MNSRDVADSLDFTLLDGAAPIHLGVGGLTITVYCSDPLRGDLENYFESTRVAPAPADATIEVLDGQGLRAEPAWIDWQREPGKTGRKDAIFDLDDGRFIRKVRTGVTFLQSPNRLVAFGPAARHPNQVINFINTQILNIRQREGWQICHAGAVTTGTRTLAIAGLSGGGKSTTVLRLMEIDGTAYVTGDRLLVRAGTPPDALGIPKLPRINPGTILHNPRLAPMLSEGRRAELSALPPDALWQLEEKHDLHIARVYGPDRLQFEAPLTHFWVLNWQRDSSDPVRIAPVDLATRPDLLSAVMKSPGPFYRKPSGSFLTDGEAPDPAGYLDALRGVEVFEVSGRVDFDALHRAGQDLLE